MHGSITRASVHSCRWNKGRIWGESKPSEYQRLSQNQSQMQAIVSHFSQFLPFSLHCLVPKKMNLILYQFIYPHFSKHQGTWHPTYQATWHPKLGDVASQFGDVAYRIQKQQEITVSIEKISKKKVPKLQPLAQSLPVQQPTFIKFKLIKTLCDR